MLVAAAICGFTPPLKVLLAGGANKELADEEGNTALAWAARMGHLPCVQLLLDAGANANTPDRLGNTPLMYAVSCKHVECARALLPASDLAARDRVGLTALHTAVASASEACFELLLPLYDVDVRTVPGVDGSGQAVPVFNESPLHLASGIGLLQMVKALLSSGADLMARDSRQWTPLRRAARGGCLACVIKLVGQIRMTPAEVAAAS